MNVRPVITGALVLIVLEVFTTTKNAGALGSLLQVPAQLASRLVDPRVAAIPDRTKK